MSFFCDVVDFFKIDNIDDKISITFVVGHGLMVVGKFKIDRIDENEIVIESPKEKVVIVGEKMILVSVAKGEIAISGSISKIETGATK